MCKLFSVSILTSPLSWKSSKSRRRSDWDRFLLIWSLMTTSYLGEFWRVTSDTDLLTLKPGDGRLYWKRGSSVHVCHQVPEDDVTVVGAEGWTWELMSKLMTVGEITEAHQRTTESISFDWGQRRLKCLKWSPLPAMSTNFPRICWDYTKIRAGGEDLKNRFPATDKAFDGLYLFVDTSVSHVWEHSLTMCWPQHNWETCSSCAWK